MEALLQDLTCPITLELFDDPVAVPCCGKAFSRAALVAQVDISGTCPLCNAELHDFDVAAAAKNTVLAGMVDTVRAYQKSNNQQLQIHQLQEHHWKCSLTRLQGLGGRATCMAELTLSVERAHFRTKPSLFIAVVDRSGSMRGPPWDQVETALLHIMGISHSNNMMKTVIIAYASYAEVIDTSGSLMQVNQRIRTMYTGGGTNFQAAFDCVQKALTENTGNFSSINIAFLTDGKAVGDKNQLSNVFSDQLREHVSYLDDQGISIPVFVHAIGFSAACDKVFLEDIRQAGSEEGTFRYAEPTDEGDALCSKLTSLFELASKGSLVPVSLAFDYLKLRNGEQKLDIQLPVNDNSRGVYSFWVEVSSEDSGTVTITSEHDDGMVVPVTVAAKGADVVFQRWLATLTDELAAELLSLEKQQMDPIMLELSCALLQQRVDAIAARVHGDSLQDRLTFIGEQVVSLRDGAGLHLGKLSDMRFSSKFANASRPEAARVVHPPAPTPQPTPTIPDTPAFERLLPHYSRSNNGMGRSELQEAICLTMFDEAGMHPSMLIARASYLELMHCDNDGNTALHLAAYCGHSKILNLLLGRLDENPTPALEAENNAGETALTIAIKKRGFDRCLLKLQAAGAKLPKNRQAPLERYCIENGYVRTAKIISSWHASAVEVTESMSPDYIMYLYNLSKEKGTEINAQSYLKAALSQRMDCFVCTLLEKHGARPTLDMLMDHCIPPKPDDPEVDKYVRLAEALLENEPMLINQQDAMEQEAPLFKAAEKGSLHHVKFFISRGAKVDQPNVLGNTALWIACAKRYPCIVSELLNNGADANWANHKGNAPMYAVCQRGPLKTAEQLIAHGAKLDLINKNGDTLILLCCRNGQHEVLRLLLNYVTPEFVAFKAHIDGFSAILAAAEQNQPDSIRVLHEFETDLEQKTDSDNPILAGATPAHIAAYYGRSAATRVLLDLGVNPNSTDASLQTPLHTAVIQGHAAIVTMLIHSKADLDAMDICGNTPMSYCRDRADIRKLLVNPALDILLKLARGGFAGKEPEACKELKCRSGALECLPQAEAVDLSDHDGSSVLMHAVLHSSFVVVRTLVDLGVNPRSTNKFGLSPILFAEHIGNQRVLRCLRSAIEASEQPCLEVEVQQQLKRLKAAVFNPYDADTFFLGCPPSYAPLLEMSSIHSRMQEFVNAPCYESYAGNFSAKDQGGLDTQIVSYIRADEAFAGIDWAPYIWNAKVLTTSLFAAGAAAVSPQEALMLSLFTSNPHIARVINTDVAKQAGCNHLARDMAVLLSGALDKLPPFCGEAYIGVRKVDRRLFPIGTEFCWPSFWSATSVWRVATESVPEFSAKVAEGKQGINTKQKRYLECNAKVKKGTVFIVKSSSGRLIGQHSQFPCDAEVIFKPATRLRVTNWYHGDVIALGQANIREHTFRIKTEDTEAMMNGDRSMIIELEEFA